MKPKLHPSLYQLPGGEVICLASVVKVYSLAEKYVNEWYSNIGVMCVIVGIQDNVFLKFGTKTHRASDDDSKESRIKADKNYQDFLQAWSNWKELASKI